MSAATRNLSAKHVRVAAERAGRVAETLAALSLMLRGYRILARRVETSAGEIDLVAVRGTRLAFVEVKQRATWKEAEAAFRLGQTTRLHRAAAHWVAARPHFRGHERGFDGVLVVPGSLPSYRPDTLQPEVSSRVWTWG